MDSNIVDPLCDCCGRPFEFPVAGKAAKTLCRLRRVSFYAFQRARSLAIYDDILSESVVLLEYEEVTRLGHRFADRLAEIVLEAPDDRQADIVVPVPLHAERRRERGYNQAELIARPLAKRLSLAFDSSLLVRTKPRPAQLVLSRTEHWRSVRGAYATRKGRKVDNSRVRLVDDVLTTGATLDSCARALEKVGARAILGLTAGRVCSRVNVQIASMPGSKDTQANQVSTPSLHDR
jgi:competence protein ComFC